VSRSWRGGGLFADRKEAGERLAEALGSLRGQPVVVLGIPRGGIEVAAAVAEALDAPLDVVIPRKIGAPGNPELGLGAVAEGVEVLDQHLIDLLGVSDDYLRTEIGAQEEEISRRSAAYRSDRPPVDLEDRIAVVVDDGVATGGTAAAALRWARSRGASKVILAVPVAPAEAIRRLAAEADEVRVLATPEQFYAVGQWYANFPQISDEAVVGLLSASAGGREGGGQQERGREEEPGG
jgi:putative phosphoribosyl transferase